MATFDESVFCLISLVKNSVWSALPGRCALRAEAGKFELGDVEGPGANNDCARMVPVPIRSTRPWHPPSSSIDRPTSIWTTTARRARCHGQLHSSQHRWRRASAYTCSCSVFTSLLPVTSELLAMDTIPCCFRSSLVFQEFLNQRRRSCNYHVCQEDCRARHRTTRLQVRRRSLRSRSTSSFVPQGNTTWRRISMAASLSCLASTYSFVPPSLSGSTQ